MKMQVSAQMVRAADNTQYAIGDAIANSTTAASVVPIDFIVARKNSKASGMITGGRCTITAASGTIVLPRFDLLLFRPVTDIPFADGSYAADNTALQISAAAMKELVAVLTFSEATWRNRDGGASASGAQVWQAVGIAGGRPWAPFNLSGLTTLKLRGLIQAQNTWNPGNVANTFDLTLDAEVD